MAKSAHQKRLLKRKQERQTARSMEKTLNENKERIDRQKSVANGLFIAGYTAGQEHLQSAVMKALGIGPERWKRVEEQLKIVVSSWDGEELVGLIEECLNEKVL